MAKSYKSNSIVLGCILYIYLCLFVYLTCPITCRPLQKSSEGLEGGSGQVNRIKWVCFVCPLLALHDTVNILLVRRFVQIEAKNTDSLPPFYCFPFLHQIYQVYDLCGSL